jgi:hypothetical protein
MESVHSVEELTTHSIDERRWKRSYSPKIGIVTNRSTFEPSTNGTASTSVPTCAVFSIATP